MKEYYTKSAIYNLNTQCKTQTPTQTLELIDMILSSKQIFHHFTVLPTTLACKLQTF